MRSIFDRYRNGSETVDKKVEHAFNLLIVPLEEEIARRKASGLNKSRKAFTEF